MSYRNPFEALAVDINEADSPEAYATAIGRLLDIAADVARSAAQNCSDAWQDPGAGRPWSAIAAKCARASESLLTLSGKIASGRV